MAKSIEQKVVDAILAGMDSNRFRPSEFSRIMATETLVPQHFDFMGLIIGYMNYLATFDQYGFYPNGLENECAIAREVAPILNREIQRLADEEYNMLQ